MPQSKRLKFSISSLLSEPPSPIGEPMDLPLDMSPTSTMYARGFLLKSFYPSYVSILPHNFLVSLIPTFHLDSVTKIQLELTIWIWMRSWKSGNEESRTLFT